MVMPNALCCTGLWQQQQQAAACYALAYSSGSRDFPNKKSEGSQQHNSFSVSPLVLGAPCVMHDSTASTTLTG